MSAALRCSPRRRLSAEKLEIIVLARVARPDTVAAFRPACRAGFGCVSPACHIPSPISLDSLPLCGRAVFVFDAEDFPIATQLRAPLPFRRPPEVDCYSELASTMVRDCCGLFSVICVLFACFCRPAEHRRPCRGCTSNPFRIRRCVKSAAGRVQLTGMPIIGSAWPYKNRTAPPSGTAKRLRSDLAGASADR